MAIRSVSFALALMLLLLVVVVGAQNPKFVSALCNSQQIPSGSPFFDTLSTLIGALEEKTPGSPYMSYKTEITGNPTAYGEAYCTSTTSHNHCYDCLIIIGDNIFKYCNKAIGAQILLDSCFLRYERYPI